MYRKPRFLEVLHGIREEMSREADYDVELFAEIVRGGGAGRAREKRRVSTTVPEPPRRARAQGAPGEARPKRTA